MKKNRVERYIYAAAELDKKFRTKVLDEIVYDKYRFIAPSHGINLVKLASHCLKARNRDLIMNIILLFIFCTSIVSTFKEYEWYGVILFIPILFTWPLFIAYIVHIIFYLYSYWIVLNKLSQNSVSKDNSDSILGIDNDTYQKLNNNQNEEETNVTYYGDYSPFVGAGIHLSGWSFVAETKLKNSDEYIYLNNSELYKYIEDRIKELQINSLRVDNQLYVDGRKIRGDSRFLNNNLSRPRTDVQIDFLKDNESIDEDHIRFYKSVQVTAWEGDFVCSVFFRIRCTEQNLYIEMQNYVLPPLKRSFEDIDKYGYGINLGIVGKAFIKSIIPSIFSLFKSPKNVYKFMKQILIVWLKKQKQTLTTKSNHAFNYGATQSIREMVADNKFHNLLQESDAEMYQKQIEQRLFQSVLEYLDMFHIDTTVFKARQETIVNHGIMITGGNVRAENISNQTFSQKTQSKVKEVFS